MAPSETELMVKVHQLRRRWRLVRAARTALVWAAWGWWLALAMAGLMKALDRPLEELLQAGWAPLLFGLGGLVRELLQPTALLRVALETDRRAQLKERLSSAVEWLQSGRSPTAITQFMVLDAAEHAARVQPTRVFPLQLGRPMLRWLAPLALMLVVLTTPSWGLWRSPIPAEEVRAVQATSVRLDELARRLPPQHPLAPQLGQRLKQLAQQLRQTGIDRQEAASRIHNLARQLEQERSKPGTSQGRSQGTGAQSSQSARDQADRLAELARKLAQDPNNPQLRQELEKARQTLAPGSPAARQAQEAAEQLNRGDAKGAAQKLTQAAESAQAQGDPQEGEGDVLGDVADSLTSEASDLDPGSAGRPSRDTAGPAMQNQAGPEGKPGGKGPGDFGVGTTNQEEKAKPEGHKGRVVRQSETTSGWKEEYQRLYGAQREHFDQANTRVHGQLLKGRVLHAQGEMLGAPQAGGRAQMQATEVYLNSKQAAEQAVVSGNIPSEYREAVRSYFDGIDPRTVH